jgi:hypothetical protein
MERYGLVSWGEEFKLLRAEWRTRWILCRGVGWRNVLAAVLTRHHISIADVRTEPMKLGVRGVRKRIDHELKDWFFGLVKRCRHGDGNQPFWCPPKHSAFVTKGNRIFGCVLIGIMHLGLFYWMWTVVARF